METKNLSQQERNSLFKKIFLYHNLNFDPELRAVWSNDLKSFSTTEIEAAWNEWRKSVVENYRKPTPVELSRIITRERNKKNNPLPLESNNELKKGRSFSEDLVIENLEKMERFPDFQKMMQEAKSVHDKLVIGFTALGKPWLIKSKISTQIEEKLNN